MFSKNIFVFFLFLFCTNAYLFSKTDQSIPGEYLLPEDHSLQPTLKKIFKKDDLFRSRGHWKAGGFDPISRAHRGLMVASHPEAPGYLFKKFMDHVPQQTQLENYLRRITGARTLGKFIEANHLERIITPKKWLYPLPGKSKKKCSYVLIVEKIDILPGNRDRDGEVAKRYATIDDETLWELCFVLFHFRGLDSVPDNLPFTYSNQIAFIDTERWEGQRDIYLRHILPLMTPSAKQQALKFFNDFEKGVMPHVPNF